MAGYRGLSPGNEFNYTRKSISPQLMEQDNYQSKLKARRIELGFSREDVATALNLTTRTIRNWETGKNEPQLLPWQSAALCRMMNCSIEELAGYFQIAIKAA